MPNILPLLKTISEQQTSISERLAYLIEILSTPREPIEPTLRFMLKPLNTHITNMESLLTLETPTTQQEIPNQNQPGPTTPKPETLPK